MTQTPKPARFAQAGDTRTSAKISRDTISALSVAVLCVLLLLLFPSTTVVTLHPHPSEIQSVI